MNVSVLFLVFTVVCVSAANLSLRYGMSSLEKRGITALLGHAVTTPWVVFGGFLYAVSMLSWLATLKYMQLGLAYPVYFGGSFALVLLGSVFLLGEDLTVRRFLGIVAIFGGILLATP